MRNPKAQKRFGFGRRALVLGVGKATLLTALAARLYYLQVGESEKYQDMAEGNRVRLYPVLPRRGKIIDRSGQVLATGNVQYRVLFTPERSADDIRVIEKVAELLQWDEGLFMQMQKKALDRSVSPPILLGNAISWEQVAKLEVHAQKLAGVVIDAPEVRYYPYAKHMAHIIGYVGRPSKDEMEDGPLFRHPDFRIGKNGLEGKFDDELQGKAGVRQIEVNARGAFVRELSVDRGTPGADITVTIDADLQRFVIDRLAGQGGLDVEGASAVVMDIQTGDVLSMASVPSYDSNQFVRGIKPDYWKMLMDSSDSPMTNKSIAAQYPPGSTFKPITALAGLELGLITEKTRRYCPGFFKYGGRKFHCWHRPGHGHVDVYGALQHSCNVFFYSMAAELGIDNLAAMARKFGLGTKCGIEMPGEKPGLVPDKAWKRAMLDKPWYNGETLNSSIGQGYLLVTPLQLALMTARLAGGRQVMPRIILPSQASASEMVMLDSGQKVFLPGEEREFSSIEVNPRNLAIVQEGMNRVVNMAGGTMYTNRLEMSDFQMAGKTGTVQVLSNRTFKHTPWKKSERYHALFVGYAPVVNPRYAISVVVEHGGYGALIAGPIGRDIMQEVYDKLGG